MEMIPCPECEASIGEDELYCPFCDEDIYNNDADDFHELEASLAEAEEIIAGLERQNSRLRKFLQREKNKNAKSPGKNGNRAKKARHR